MRNAFLWLLTATVAFEGLRAGAGTFRALLDLPARADIGPVAFAQLSRATDLSMAGVAYYAIYGFGGFLLTLAAFVASLFWQSSRRVRLLAGFSAAAPLLILVFTLQAAPLMWAIGSSPDDPVVLNGLIEPFVFWTNLRIVLADLSFLAVLLALAILKREERVQRTRD
jgi:hypothetical protein